MGMLRKLTVDRFGVAVIPVTNPEISSVGVAAARVLRQNPDRLGFNFVNLSPNDMYVGPFADVSSSKGIKVGPNGGSLATVWIEDFESVGVEWFVLATAAASNLLMIEYVAEQAQKA